MLKIDYGFHITVIIIILSDFDYLLKSGPSFQYFIDLLSFIKFVLLHYKQLILTSFILNLLLVALSYQYSSKFVFSLDNGWCVHSKHHDFLKHYIG